MSVELNSAIENANFLLPRAIPEFESGSLPLLGHAHGLAASYRSRGVAQMLLRGVADPLFIAQMQSVSLYLFGLRRASEQEKVTSLGACLWDAIAADYWDAAVEIATLSRKTHSAAREHEDDFLYVVFLMHRYLLAPAADAPAEEQQAHEQQQTERLDRWQEVLEGGLDPRLDLCHALVDQDQDAFEESLLTAADDRKADLERRHEKGAHTNEELAWLLPVWPEGLALLRLAEREGFDTAELEVPGVPPVIRVPNPFAYYPDAWRSLDISPPRRPA